LGCTFFGNPIYKNVNILLLCPSCAQIGDQERCYEEGLEEEGILDTASFVSLWTVDLDLFVYFGGFPDNLWTLILYMC